MNSTKTEILQPLQELKSAMQICAGEYTLVDDCMLVVVFPGERIASRVLFFCGCCCHVLLVQLQRWPCLTRVVFGAVSSIQLVNNVQLVKMSKYTIGQNTNGENTIGQTIKISNWFKYTGTLGTNITIVLRQNHEMMPKGGRRLPPVEANQSMLNQVLMNLIFNARDAIR
jgi:hypothetical protein